MSPNVVNDLQHPDLPEGVRHALFLREWRLEGVAEIKVFRGIRTLVQEIREPGQGPENDSVVADDGAQVKVNRDGGGRTDQCLRGFAHAASPSSESAGNCAMSRVEGTRNGIDEQKGNAKVEQIAALDRLLVATAVLVALQLDEPMERLVKGAWMSRGDAERVAAVHEDAGLAPEEIGSWWVSRDEVIVESDAEGVEALLDYAYLPYPSAANASLIVGVIAALHGRGHGLRGGDRGLIRSGCVGSRDCDEDCRRRGEQSSTQAPNQGSALRAATTATHHRRVLSFGGAGGLFVGE